MDAIEANCSDVERRLEEVVKRWQQDGDNPSWETLARAATFCRMGGGKNVALKIRQRTGLGEGVAHLAVTHIHFNCYYMYVHYISVVGHAEQKSAGTTTISPDTRMLWGRAALKMFSISSLVVQMN